MTFGLVPGTVMLDGAGPWLPAAAQIKNPASQASSTAFKSPDFFLPWISALPAEMFTIRISYSFPCSISQYSARARLALLPLPSLSRTFSERKWHRGASPWYLPPDASPVPPMIPQIWVP